MSNHRDPGDLANDLERCKLDSHDLVVEFDGSMVGAIVDGRYKVGRRLGAGGIGRVYLAERLELGRVVAIKFLKREHAAVPEIRRRFAREALAMSRLYHRHVVSLIDYGVHLGRPYLVMEFVPGETLFALIRKGPVAPGRALAIMQQLLTTLEYFHRQGVVHRDLKPENIMLADNGETGDFVKLLDFGMAKLLEGLGAEIDVSVKGQVMGTPSTMSPEQIRELPIDGRSDLYSTGAILYQLITGQKVFPYRKPFQILEAHLRTQPTAPSQILGEGVISEELERVMLRALAKDRDQRFQSAREMAGALARTPESGESGEHAGYRPGSRVSAEPASGCTIEFDSGEFDSGEFDSEFAPDSVLEPGPRRGRGLLWFALLGWSLFGLLLAAVAIVVVNPEAPELAGVRDQLMALAGWPTG